MDATIALKLIMAAVLGGLVGFERQLRDKPAGLRTNMLICIGATQFMTISTRVADILGGDPTRIAAQIITGIGFLGAGAVLQSHGIVVGLTTAATIWVVAGIGMALGGEMYGTALLTTALTIVTLYFLSVVERRLQRRQSVRFSLVVRDLSDGLAAVQRVLDQYHVASPDLSFVKDEARHRVRFQVFSSRDTTQRILAELSREPAIAEAEVSGAPGAEY